MADIRPTKISILRAFYLCILLIIAPKKFLREEVKDNQARKNFSGQAEREPSAMIVRRAFGISLLLVLLSGLIGYGLGFMAGHILGCVSNKITTILLILGALALLWGTLFVRGWEIQTYCGVTLTERANQWLYRALYCFGTAIIVFSLVWPQCKD
jgi:hypothetical protein